MEKMFEKATKSKLRFSTNKGQLSVEDLWDLSLVSLDTIAKDVNKALKADQEESFISPKSTVNSELTLKLEILKYIIQVKQEEKEKSKLRAEKQAQLATLKELAAQKSGEALSQKSLEEIQAMIAELES